jgi:hypothetical protein
MNGFECRPGGWQGAARRLLLACFATVSVCSVAQEVASPTDSQTGEGATCPREGGCDTVLEDPGADNWADKSYEYVTYRADNLAVWLDSFFGEVGSDLEAADSRLRLRLEYKWDEDDGDDTKVRLRGKVDLPRLDDRLSIVFSSEDDEDREDVVPGSAGEDNTAALQYRLAETARSQLNFTVGVSSGLDYRTGLRYRYTYPISDLWRARFTERLYYKQDDGAGSVTRVDLDFSPSRDRLIRWSSDVEYGEETNGAEWGSSLAYRMRLSEKEGLVYFGAVSGETDPDYLTKDYALGIKYRRNFLRRWMFFEIEPSHVWRKKTADDNREPVWVITLRLEFLEEIENRLGGDGQ